MSVCVSLFRSFGQRELCSTKANSKLHFHALECVFVESTYLKMGRRQEKYRTQLNWAGVWVETVDTEMLLQNAYMNSMTNGMAQMYESTFKSWIVFLKLFQIKETKHYKWHLLVILRKYIEPAKCRASRFGWLGWSVFFSFLFHKLAYVHTHHSRARTHSQRDKELRKKMKSFLFLDKKIWKPFKIYLLYSLQIAGSLWLELFLLLSAFLCKYFFFLFSILCYYLFYFVFFPSTSFIVIEFGNRFSLGYHFKRKIHQLWICTKIYILHKKNFPICNPLLMYTWML